MSDKRFAERSEEEIGRLIRSKDPSSTKKPTKQDVKALREFFIEKEMREEQTARFIKKTR